MVLDANMTCEDNTSHHHHHWTQYIICKTSYTPQKIAISRSRNFSQVFANSSVDRKIAKLGSYRKINAKYTGFTTIIGVAFLSSPHYNDLLSPAASLSPGQGPLWVVGTLQSLEQKYGTVCL